MCLLTLEFLQEEREEKNMSCTLNVFSKLWFVSDTFRKLFKVKTTNEWKGDRMNEKKKYKNCMYWGMVPPYFRILHCRMRLNIMAFLTEVSLVWTIIVITVVVCWVLYVYILYSYKIFMFFVFSTPNCYGFEYILILWLLLQ